MTLFKVGDGRMDNHTMNEKYLRYNKQTLFRAEKGPDEQSIPDYQKVITDTVWR